VAAAEEEEDPGELGKACISGGALG